MSFLCSPLALINPLHHERCIASSPHGGVCPESIDFTKRVSAHLERALSKPESKPETQAINFRDAARLIIYNNHKNQLREARRIAPQKSQHTSSLRDRRYLPKV
ncbi:hypothetical protein BJX63DRAFT_444547 [Aspergillus granulosus]|uniref:Uncharacterized protein n=1 Tax=Aspergillus granulosus TaxID=176169 RepID=A0ABR4H551_9EURO